MEIHGRRMGLIVLALPRSYNIWRRDKLKWCNIRRSWWLLFLICFTFNIRTKVRTWLNFHY